MDSLNPACDTHFDAYQRWRESSRFDGGHRKGERFATSGVAMSLSIQSYAASVSSREELVPLGSCLDIAPKSSYLRATFSDLYYTRLVIRNNLLQLNACDVARPYGMIGLCTLLRIIPERVAWRLRSPSFVLE